MAANSARKYRAYPTPEQAERLDGWTHMCRAVWNMALEQRQYAWKQRRKSLRAIEQNAHLTKARAELDWLSDLPAQSAQQVLRNLDRAYDNWWNPSHAAGGPMRKKRSKSASVSFPGQAIQVEKLNARWGRVRVPKLGWIRFRFSRAMGGAVRNATFSHNALGWHVAFGVESSMPNAGPNGLPGCGVDFGVAVAAFVSDEERGRLMAPTLSPGERARLQHLERKQARQMRWAKRHNSGTYSARLRETITKIAETRGRQARRRLDFTHKLTTDLTKSHGWVAIENLNVKGMTKSSRGTLLSPGTKVAQKSGLNRSILDNMPGERRRQLEYKALIHGSEIRAVPAPYTSQRCSACGIVDAESRLGCGRAFACTHCGHTDHADRNAAHNIKRLAEGQPAVQHASTTPVVVRPRKVSRTRAALTSA